MQQMYRSVRSVERDIAVLQAYTRGENNAVIGRKLGLTRERVRQLLKRLGLRSRRLGGASRLSIVPEHTQEVSDG